MRASSIVRAYSSRRLFARLKSVPLEQHDFVGGSNGRAGGMLVDLGVGMRDYPGNKTTAKPAPFASNRPEESLQATNPASPLWAMLAQCQSGRQCRASR
jgi:hypothetical protein